MALETVSDGWLDRERLRVIYALSAGAMDRLVQRDQVGTIDRLDAIRLVATQSPAFLEAHREEILAYVGIGTREVKAS